jgi:hypothetical protein
MVFFSIGLPSRFAEWCDRLVLRLVERQLGSAEAVALNSLDELASAVVRTKAASLVACCRQPVLRLQTEILQAQRPFLVALGDPRAALRNLIESAGFQLPDATRAVASSCAAMLTITKAANALALTPDPSLDAYAAAAMVARHFELPLDRAEIAAVVDSLADTGVELTQDDALAWSEELSERERAIIDGAFEPYIAHFGGAPLERLVWEPELFYVTVDPPSAGLLPLTGPVDVTGRTRFVVYGPFINLPPGAWSADVVLGFSAETSGVAFIIEVFAGSQLAHARIEVAGEQVIQSRLYFTIENSVDQAVQIRVFNERAAFDGRLALGYVAMTPQATIPGDTRERLAEALRQ